MDLELPDEGELFAIARRLIEMHGDDTAQVVQAMVDRYFESGDIVEFNRWAMIRNAVSLSLDGPIAYQ